MRNFKILAVLLFALLSVLSVKAQENPTNPLLVTYYDLKEALAADNAELAQTKAKALLTTLNTYPVDQLTGANKNNWTKFADKLKTDAGAIAESGDIAVQRERFGTLSQNIYEIVKALKINTATVYRQYCPMKKLYWLSATSAIKNPYYGNQMLTCGTVKETLAP